MNALEFLSDSLNCLKDPELSPGSFAFCRDLRYISSQADTCQWLHPGEDRNALIITTDFILCIHAIFLGKVGHGPDVFRLCLIKERTIAHDKTTAFTNSIDEFLAVVSHFIGFG